MPLLCFSLSDILNWVLPEEPKTRIWGKVIYFRGDLRSIGRGRGYETGKIRKQVMWALLSRLSLWGTEAQSPGGPPNGRMGGQGSWGIYWRAPISHGLWAALIGSLTSLALPACQQERTVRQVAESESTIMGDGTARWVGHRQHPLPRLSLPSPSSLNLSVTFSGKASLTPPLWLRQPLTGFS